MSKTKRFNTDIRRAALYIRVSSEEQAIHGLSLDAQEETLKKYAADNHLDIVGIFRDEGITARKSYKNRKEFTRMMELVKREEIDVILFIKLDRWFRNIADYYEVQRVLDEHHVHWIATEEEYDTTTANGRLHLNIKLSIAQDESDRTGERIKFVFEGKRARGEVLSGKVPYGYKIVNKKLEIDEEKAAYVRDIFDTYIAKRSLHYLRDYSQEKYGITHEILTFRRYIENKKYKGELYGISGGCPAIVDEETFNLANEIVSERQERYGYKQNRIYIFKGILKCAECGRNLVGKTPSHHQTSCYRCSNAELHKCSHNTYMNERKIEEWMIDHLIEQCERYNIELQQKKAESRPKIDISKIKVKMERLKDLYLSGLLDKDTYAKDYLKFSEQLREAETPIERNSLIDIPTLKNMLSVYHTFNNAEKKEFWTKAVKCIHITNDKQIFVTLR